MKPIVQTIAIIICFFASSLINAQNAYPSQAELNQVEKELKFCESERLKMERMIRDMERNPESVTLGEYNGAKEYLKGLKECIKSTLKVLDEMKKKYPEWANNQSMETNERRDETHDSPDVYEQRLENLKAHMEWCMEAINSVPTPDH